jgi:hypothetical protein
MNGRTIKSKAKIIDSGKWVFGFYVEHPITGAVMFVPERHGLIEYLVVRSSVCEFINDYTFDLTNNKKFVSKEIYEGDIIRVHISENKESVLLVVWDTDNLRWKYKHISGIARASEEDILYSEIIGNINDTPGFDMCP